MSLNVTVLTQEYAACGTDRRLSTSNAVVSERGCKLAQFACGSAKGLITYNGIGRSNAGETPNDWVSTAIRLGDCSLVEFCERLKSISETRLTALASQFGGNPRHTFAISAFENGIPIIGILSNYEGFDSSNQPDAAASLTLDLRSMRPTAPFGLLVTGDTSGVKRQKWNALRDSLRRNHSAKSAIRAITKTIRDAAYSNRPTGSVGTSILGAICHRNSGFEMFGDVVGGTVIQESPDFITTGAEFRQIWFAGLKDGEEMPTGFRPGLTSLPESQCLNPDCRNPIPMGYRSCPACDTPVGP